MPSWLPETSRVSAVGGGGAGEGADLIGVSGEGWADRVAGEWVPESDGGVGAG